MEVYAIKTNEVLVFVSFNVLGQLEDVGRGIKEVNESIKAWSKNVSSDIKGMTESMKEGVKDIKKDIKEVVKEVVKEGLKESMKEMKNIEKPEMKEDSTRMPMGNIDRDDFPNPKVPALGELYLVWFYFYIKMIFFRDLKKLSTHYFLLELVSKCL